MFKRLIRLIMLKYYFWWQDRERKKFFEFGYFDKGHGPGGIGG